MGYDANAYGPVFAGLLSEERVMPLGPGRADDSAREDLEAMTVDRAFAERSVADTQLAACALAGVWLYHDFLERSHQISQSVTTPTGSYWHGIMHRREPDYPNAKYWFRNAGDHPLFGSLASEAAELAARSEDPRAARLTSGAGWDPYAFIDLCEAAAGEGGEFEALCRRIQMREWWLLFDFCYRGAIGG